MSGPRTITNEERLAMKAKGLVGRRVVIKKVTDPTIPQYDFAIGKKGRIENVSPSDVFPLNIRLENGMLLCFAEDEVELIPESTPPGYAAHRHELEARRTTRGY